MTETDTTPPGAAPGAEYQVIARRYRPRFFHEVVGQEATAEALRQALLQQRLAHAYLFCGPRGVGKTSMARIFARALQCPNSENGNPCDQCATCDRIFRGEDMDVTEMDGASHRGIDDVRDLIQHVRYAPTQGPYRIFIIDEVHMLTREAFNALLKTLEEPPSHVKFIFATTEAEKILATVLSRCQRCDFSPISSSDIVRRLEQICEIEKAQPEEGLLERVADLARGGMRDSQSLLDQLLSFAGSQPAHDDLNKITGRVAPQKVNELIDCLEGGDRAAVVRELVSIEQGGTDPGVLLEQIMEQYRARLHAGVDSDWGNADIERNLLAQEILQEARMRSRQLSRADVIVELALLRITTLADLLPIEQWIGGAHAGEGGGGRSGAPAAARPRVPQQDASVVRQDARPASPTPRSGQGQAAPGRATSSRPTPQAEAPAKPTRQRPPEASRRDEPDRASVRPDASPASPPPASTAGPGETSAPSTGGGGLATATGGENDRERVRDLLESAAPTVARMVGDRFTVDTKSEEIVFELDSAAARFVDGKRLEECRQLIRQELGEKFRIRVEVGKAMASSEEGVAEEDASADDDPPEIVNKAKEIFRGTVQRSTRPKKKS